MFVGWERVGVGGKGTVLHFLHNLGRGEKIQSVSPWISSSFFFFL